MRRRRIPWLAITLTILVGVTAMMPLDAIRNAADFSVIGDARLERGLAYSMLGPVSAMFDAMTLFTAQQIIGFTLWAMGLYVVGRIVRRFYNRVSWKREAIYAVASFAALLLIYAAAVVLPRPMARLVVILASTSSASTSTRTRSIRTMDVRDGRRRMCATGTRRAVTTSPTSPIIERSRVRAKRSSSIRCSSAKKR